VTPTRTNDPHEIDTTENADYYSDRKFCTTCNGYVSYLMSVDHSYCTTCGNEVRLFSKEDWSEFQRTIAERRPKGGRPRKNANDRRETA